METNRPTLYWWQIQEPRILLVGLGNPKDVSSFQIKVAFANSLKQLRNLPVRTVSTFIDPKTQPNEIQNVVAFIVEAAYLSQYLAPNYKKNARKVKTVEHIHLIIPEGMDGVAHQIRN